MRRCPIAAACGVPTARDPCPRDTLPLDAESPASPTHASLDEVRRQFTSLRRLRSPPCRWDRCTTKLRRSRSPGARERSHRIAPFTHRKSCAGDTRRSIFSISAAIFSIHESSRDDKRHPPCAGTLRKCSFFCHAATFGESGGFVCIRPCRSLRY